MVSRHISHLMYICVQNCCTLPSQKCEKLISLSLPTSLNFKKWGRKQDVTKQKMPFTIWRQRPSMQLQPMRNLWGNTVATSKPTEVYPRHQNYLVLGQQHVSFFMPFPLYLVISGKQRAILQGNLSQSTKAAMNSGFENEPLFVGNKNRVMFCWEPCSAMP